MRVLLDTCVWGGAMEYLKAIGHDVTWSGSWSEDPGDEAILSFAHREHRILITLDKDFGELIFLRGMKHSGVVRLVGFRAQLQGPACAKILDLYSKELLAGAIVTTEPGKIRIRFGNI